MPRFPHPSVPRKRGVREGGDLALAADRQAHLDARALPRAALDADAAAVELDEPLDDRQAETGAVVLARVGAARLEERVAEPREVVGRDADAGVLDREQDVLAVLIGADRHGA